MTLLNMLCAFQVRTPQGKLGSLSQIFPIRLGSGPPRHTPRASLYSIQRTNLKKRSGTPSDGLDGGNMERYDLLTVATAAARCARSSPESGLKKTAYIQKI